MQNSSISRTSSIATVDNFRVGSFSGSDTESDAGTHHLSIIPEEGTVRGNNMITPQQWQSNSIKAKLLKLFCCR